MDGEYNVVRTPPAREDDPMPDNRRHTSARVQS